MSLEEDDASIGFSQATEDLEQPSQDSEEGNDKQKDVNFSNQINNRRSLNNDKQKLLKISKFDKNLLKYKYCEICDDLCPPRARHCPMCRQCVLKMDHH